MVICLERGANLHMAQLMPLPLTVSCFSKIQIGFTFLVPAHQVVPDKGPLNGCVFRSRIRCALRVSGPIRVHEFGVHCGQPAQLRGAESRASLSVAELRR